VVATVSELDGAQPAAANSPTKAAPAPIRANNVRRVCSVFIELLLILGGAANHTVAVRL
jgi:hypothetical protein